jgi:hypothetical protein
MKNNTLYLRILYPLWAIIGMYSILYVPSALIDINNPTLTAQKISDHELLFRSGILGSIVTQLLFIIITWMLGNLFQNMNKKTVELMSILAYISIPITLLNEINQFAVLFHLDQTSKMQFFIQLHQHGMTIASIFWGLWLFPLGYLIYQSGCAPKWIGISVLIAGFAYVIGFLIKIIFPHPSSYLAYIEPFTFGEVIWMLWITIAGTRKSWALA